MARDIGDTLFRAAQGIVQQNQTAQQLQLQTVQIAEQMRQAEANLELRDANLALREQQLEISKQQTEIGATRVKQEQAQAELMSKSLDELGLSESMIRNLGFEGGETMNVLTLVGRLRQTQLAQERIALEIEKLNAGEPIKSSERRQLFKLSTNNARALLQAEAREDPERFGFPKQLVEAHGGLLDETSVLSQIRALETRRTALELANIQNQKTIASLGTDDPKTTQLLRSINDNTPQIQQTEEAIAQWRQYLGAIQEIDRRATFDPNVRGRAAAMTGIAPDAQLELDLATTRDPVLGSNLANFDGFSGAREFAVGQKPRLIQISRSMARQLMDVNSTPEDQKVALDFFFGLADESALTKPDFDRLAEALEAMLLEHGNLDRLRELGLEERLFRRIAQRNQRAAGRNASTQRAAQAAQQPTPALRNPGNTNRAPVQNPTSTR